MHIHLLMTLIILVCMHIYVIDNLLRIETECTYILIMTSSILEQYAHTSY